MEHLFAFNDQTKKYETNGSCSSLEAEQALLEGAMFYKIDGSNGMVQVIHDSSDFQANPPMIRIYQRLDTRGSPPPSNNHLIPLPAGRNSPEYKGHSYYYDEITEHVAGKKLSKRNRAMLELVERCAEKLVLLGQEFISVEWVGQMFNKTPNVPHAVAMALHQDQKVSEKVNNNIVRSYTGICKYLLEDCTDEPVEGLILEHHGVFYKVRADCFLLPRGVKDPFRAKKDKARPPIFLT